MSMLVQERKLVSMTVSKFYVIMVCILVLGAFEFKLDVHVSCKEMWFHGYNPVHIQSSMFYVDLNESWRYLISHPLIQYK